MALTELHVESSLITWFSDNYSGNADWGSLDQFDPEADDMESWVHFHIDKCTVKPYRKNNKRIIDIRIVVQCWSRDTEDNFGEKDLYRARRKASEIANLLEHKEIPVYDYADEDEPQVGNCRLYEPRITCETDRTDDENLGYSMYMVILDGCVQEV